jgi:hypothetical protein
VLPAGAADEPPESPPPPQAANMRAAAEAISASLKEGCMGGNLVE